nr:uncharacterized protein LOC125424044 [Ziziphus jujuba var. spinosa]XP_048336198.1 uncharacterized protein LOC125424044 [Ziziphus jujuba var. spinosa]XP_048336199.1 uncharacterized protein LOC125424044 [Ziziphus jujuba var. spinosa]
MWRACNDAIPCFSLLSSRHITDARECPICHRGEENVLHVFWGCLHVSRLWKLLDFWQELKGCVYDSFSALCYHVFTNLSQFQRERFSWICWSIWNNRNAFLHDSFVKSNAQLLDSVSRLHVEFLDVKLRNTPQCPPQHLQNCSIQCWRPPQGDNFKINVDAAVPLGDSNTGIGVVVRDSSGALMGAMAKPFDAAWSVKYSELMAIYEGLCFCMEAGFSRGELISDCHDSVCAVNSAASVDHLRLNVLLSCCPGIVCKFESRVQNKVPHCIAKYATRLSVFESWLETGPQWLLSLLNAGMCNPCP